MKIAARETSGVSSFSHLRAELTFTLSAQIHIKEFRTRSDNVYGTTIHELTHSQHWQVDSEKYNELVRGAFLEPASGTRNRKRRLLETWPTTVEIMFTRNRYRNTLGVLDFEFGILENLQDQLIADSNHYTSGGWDMIDNINQRTHPDFGNGITAWPVDNVSGYNLLQLQNALRGANKWNDWRDNIIRLYNNNTEDNLNELFANWQD